MRHLPYIIYFPSFDKLNLQQLKNVNCLMRSVGSILNYSSEVLGNHDAKDIEILHTKFYRWVLHVRKSSKSF